MKKHTAIFFVLICLSVFSTQAQVTLRPEKVGINIIPQYTLHIDSDVSMNADPAFQLDFENAVMGINAKGMQVESVPLNMNGSQFGGKFFVSTTSPANHIGSAEGTNALMSTNNNNGSFKGVLGFVASTSLDNSNASQTSSLIGGDFRTNPNTNLSLSVGRYWIAGVRGRIEGAINNDPDDGAIAAVLGVDSNTGSAESWAGYFLGNGHVSDKLTIATTNMPTSLGSNSLSDYKLYVNGGILANEWLVPNVSTWGDYVFEADYALKSLPEVEQQIEAKGHLHNTPSAKEVENNGLAVAAMTINQQVKIEEIFLHLIEMDKRMKALEEKNERLEEENKTLKAALKLD
ncbi:MAG: hypothetical protein AAF806_01895 [Bacteroidota bacterium]